MNRMVEDFAVMLGRTPDKPAHCTPEATRMLAAKRTPEAVIERRRCIAGEKDHKPNHFWRNWRWVSIIAVNLLFVLSYRIDIQVVEGALTASRFVGFHMADLNSALQVMLAYKHVVINLVIGTGTVLIFWLLLGGRSFCAWVCPYHLLSEIAEQVHLKLAAKKIVGDHALHRGTRTVLWLVFAGLAIVTGYTVFEVISPVGILSRAFTYGASLALLWVAFLLVIEIVYSRRFWCRYICPIGLTYGVVGAFSPVRVVYDMEKCLHEGKCRKVCLVPHVLGMTRLGYASDVKRAVGADCTRCGMCVEVCPSRALRFEIKGLDKLL